MAEGTPTSSGPARPVADALRSNRKPLTAAVGVCVAALVAALAIPVDLPDAGGTDTRDSLGSQPVKLAPAEDLAAFAASRRWGGDAFEDLEARRRAAEADSDADAARRDRMGFVGSTATPGDRVVLLTLPGGEVARIRAGGELPDGRKVSSATGTTATLSGRPGEQEELQLFPRDASALPVPPREGDASATNEAEADPNALPDAPW